MSENKEKISISIDAQLLERIDAVCEARGDTRSAMIERMLFNDIAGEEEFIRDMESPVNRAIISAMANTPGLLAGVAKLIGQHLEPADLERLRGKLPEHIERGKERQRGRRIRPRVEGA